MSEQARVNANRRVLFKSLTVVVAMFGFGFALVPLYNVFCEITGVNGKTGRVANEQALSTLVDESRWITVEFVASVNDGMPWEFHPLVRKVRVHPGEIGEVAYYAQNLSDRMIVGQAVPSVAPSQASLYFNKTECFCFTQQAFGPGEGMEMPVRFVIDPDLPQHIRTVTLSYTFFDTDATGVTAVGKDPRAREGSGTS